MPRFEVVCFDLGGVMIQIHHNWDDAVEAAGVEFSKANIGPLGGFEGFNLYQDGQIVRSEYLAELKNYIGVSTAQDAHRVHMAITRTTYPGIDKLVKELREADQIVGCMSNTSEMHWETFFEGGNHEFGPLLQIRVGSHLVKASKPEKVIYRAFEKASGFQGDQIVFFDDGPLNVEAAKSLGWHAHLINPFSDTARQMRTHLRI